MWVTTLSQKLIIALIAESNRGGFFSKSLVDPGCDNIPKSPKKRFFKKCGLHPFVSSQSICQQSAFSPSARMVVLLAKLGKPANREVG